MNEKAKAVRLMIFDVDGVMTDGGLHYSDSGVEIKVFNSRDGHGIKALKASGVKLAIITGRTSQALAQRAAQFNVEYLYQGVEDKLAVFHEILADAGLTPAECGYMGDDVVDLPVMRRVAFAVAVPDAPEIVRQHAHYISGLPGGRGAVREVCDLIMQAQGTLESSLAHYLR